MSGIVGFIKNKESSEEVIKKMTASISHRGPDGEGFYTDDDIALGQRILSVIDLSSSSQPLLTKDKSLAIIHDGEVYNYKELRSELRELGYKFKTKGDKEVILHGFQEWGSKLPEKLRGMFAFVIWDKNNKTLFAARDHFGIKPFYYYEENNNFMFASEIKALLEHPNFVKELNKELIIPYLTFGYTPGEDTLFKGVKSLKPGHTLTYKEGKISINRYFRLTFKEEDNKDIIDKIGETMKDSVNHHLISDVEIGSFLSSGIDSSYLVSLAQPNKTYTVGYNNDKYNEIAYAKELTSALNINNTGRVITKEEYLRVIPKIMYHMDEPLADPSAVALYFVSALASKDVKIVLSGEGADELFGGYNTYREEVDYTFYNKIPFFMRRIVAKICSLLPEVRGINFLVRRGQLEEEYIGINRIFSDRQVKKVVKEKTKVDNRTFTRDCFEEQEGNSRLVKMQAIDINFWAVKDVLLKADRMTMANSIEGRVPFLDIEVFKVARTIPDEGKVTKENTKVNLRSAAKKVIPNESYKKKKLGFPVPLREWLREEDFYIKLKNSFSLPIVEELFNKKRLLKLLDNHYNNKKDNYKKLWAVYCFIVWYQVFFESEAQS